MELGALLDSLRPHPDGGLTLSVPEDWHQGRTLYGGLNAALAARSVRSAPGIAADLGPLRTLQIAFIAPVAGEVRYAPTLLRQGRSVSFVGVDCLTGAGLGARAILTYGRARASDLAGSRLRPPAVPAPADCPEWVLAAGTPAFLAHVELRFAAGSPPFSGGEPAFSMWVRHRHATGVDPEGGALAIADVLPPAVLASRRAFSPASSVTWTVDLVESPPDPAGWYLLSTASDRVAEGYSLAALSCFDASGGLVAVGRQTQAVF